MASKKKRKKNPIEMRNEKRSINKAAREHRRQRNVRKPRRNDWSDYADDEFHDAGFERIMPRDEGERRLRVETLAEKQPLNPDDSADDVSEDIANGRVVEVSSGMCRVLVDDEVLLCTVRGALKQAEMGFTNVVTVGDLVTVDAAEPGHGVVEEIHPRRSYIARPAPGTPHMKQLLVANVDQLMIVQAWRNPNIWYELIDRYLITAVRAGVRPVICVNKVDLTDDLKHIRAELAPYEALGYEVHFTSAQTGFGMDGIRGLLESHVTAVAGLSGVGKSSLLSAALPGFDLRTGAVNDERGQGRHTTTQATMLPFGDGFVIDTPGIREFGLAGLTQHDLVTYYPEIHTAAARCKFADCTHTHEPECGVLEELAVGGISEIRYHSYTVIRNELPET